MICRLLLFFSVCWINAFTQSAYAQPDTLARPAFHPTAYHPTVSSFVIPVTLTAYGFAALKWEALESFDKNIREEVWEDNPHHTFPLDNYLQYTPALAVYVLNAAGIKGQHDLRDRTIIYVLANGLMGVSVLSLKKIINAPRPDGSGNDGFPSGHTATAFLAAEFLRQEFKDRSPWYGIAGYTAATGTAFLRVYNDKHWFSELTTGAGIGIIAAKVTYWVWPCIERQFLPRKKTKYLW